MNRKELEAFAKEAAKGIKTEGDLNDFRQVLTKITVEAALKAELEEHLGYCKHVLQTLITAVTATPARPCVPKMGNLNLIRHATGWVTLSHS